MYYSVILIMAMAYEVCKREQNTANQRREIEAVEHYRIIEEKISGSIAASERPGFSCLLGRMEHGDVLIVTKLDRLDRNAIDIRKTVEKLSELNIRVHYQALVSVDLRRA